MDKNLHHIEELFKSALDDYDETPSSNSWNAVESRLNKDNVADVKRKYNTLKRVALLLLLLLIGIGIYELSRNTGAGNIAKRNQHQHEKKNLDDNVKKTLPASKMPDSKQSAAGNKISTSPETHDLNYPAINNNEQLINKKSITKKPVAAKSNLDGSNPATETKAVSPEKSIKHYKADYKTTPSKYFILQPHLIASSVYHPFILSDPKKQIPQPLKPARIRPARFSITAFLSPDFASYRLENDDHSNQADNINKIEKTENHESSSTAGILIGYRLNNRWSIQSGLSFSNINILLKPKTIYAQPDNNGDIKYRFNFSSGYSYILPSFQNTPAIGDSLTATAAAHKLRYINIPVIASYEVSKGKFSFAAMTGVSINFLDAGVLETEVRDGANNEIDILNDIEGLKSTYFNWQVGIGTEYRLTNKLSLTLAPTARFALTSINKGSVVRSYPNSIGLVGGLKMRF